MTIAVVDAKVQVAADGDRYAYNLITEPDRTSPIKAPFDYTFDRELQSLVAFEFKVDKFQPEYLGQLEFYLEALDRDIKKPHDVTKMMRLLNMRSVDRAVLPLLLNMKSS